MANYQIRKMKKDEVPLALEWARQEGWNPGLNDASCFYQADPNGFFIGLLDEEPIAVGSAVVYSDDYAFCGLYIVKKEFRQHGYGLSLTEERLRYAGNRITGIDGVLENVSKYERLGYISSHKQIRYVGSGNPCFEPSPHLVNLQKLSFENLKAFDRQFFPAPRTPFLKAWISAQNGHALGYLQNEMLQGYGVIRPCVEGYKIGPLFAETPQIAHVLFEGLCLKVNQGPIFLDIPEPHLNALQLVEQYGMTPQFEVMRMYRNGIPSNNLHEGIYGVTTFELG